MADDITSEQPENEKSRIEELRKGIDAIDEKILGLINQRLGIGKEIGSIKAVGGIKVLDQAREKQIFDRLRTLNAGPLKDSVVEHIFSVIMAASREIQKPLMVAYLGPEATYTHMAAMSHFGHAGTFIPQPSIRDIFETVGKGVYQYGVVPVENSIEGAVNHTLDLLFESDLKICAERYQNISHDLLSNESGLDSVRVVYSHPQPFGQCRAWLRKNLPDAVLKETSSTAHAAQIASVEPGAAAIASHVAARTYNLKILSRRIEDYARNVTRFLVISKEEAEATGKDKTTLMFVTSHSPGALFHVLQPIAVQGLNMVKLESRPTKHENWKYFFTVDLEGHQTEPRIQKAMQEMAPLCLFLRCLGSYPKGDDAGGELSPQKG